MLSLGTELDFALAIASARVGLPAGSPPPVRAATSTFLISFANSLPRRASTTAFLCLVVASLWCSLTKCPLSRLFQHLLEQPMHAQVIRKLGMECSSKQGPLSYDDNLTVAAAQNLDLAAGRLHPRSTDEHAWRGATSGPFDRPFERVDLTAEGIAPHRHIDATDERLVIDAVDDAVRQQDHPGTRSVSRQPRPNSLLQRLEQLEGHEQLAHRGRLPAGNDDAVDSGKLVGTA